ncbi:putative membrane protein [Thermoplasmatales archaeon]|nr:putative membrane protein [Thermoplasmatales archaeon]
MSDNSAKHRSIEDLTRFVRGAPGWKFYIVPLIFIMGIDYLLIRSLRDVLIGIFLSFVFVLVFDRIFILLGKFVFPMRRIAYLDFVSFGIWTIIFWIVHFLNLLVGTESQVFFSIAFVSFFRLLIFYVYYSEKVTSLLLPSLNYTYAGIVSFAYIYGGYPLIIPFLLASLASALIAVVFTKIVLSKFSKDYGVSATKLLQFFLNFRSVGDTDQVGKEFFERIYRKEQVVPVKVIDILSGEKSKVTMVFPYVHPGPFGRLGCSDLPIRLQEKLPDIGRELMVFHTTTTHSNNCQGEDDIERLAEGIKKALSKIQYVDTMSRFRKLNAGKYSIGMIRIGDFGFGSIIPEREPFDDVELGEGMRVMESIKTHGARDFALIDAQNNFTKGAKELRDCDDLIKPFTREFGRNIPNSPAMIGFSSLKTGFPGLAGMGIQTLAFRTGERLDAIVLTDSNNITSSTIEKVRKKSANIVSNVEIYTTDNHIVNASTLDVFPLGIKGDIDLISELIVGTIKEAVKDVNEVKVGMGSANVMVKMGEENSYHKLTENVLSTVRKAKYAIAGTLPMALVISYLIFLVPFSLFF